MVRDLTLTLTLILNHLHRPVTLVYPYIKTSPDLPSDLWYVIQLLLISVLSSKMPERQVGGDPYLLLYSEDVERSEAGAAC